MPVSYKKLWKLLIDKDMKKSDLRTVAGLSTGTLAKLGKGESVSTDVLVRICRALDCDIGDIMEVLPEMAVSPMLVVRDIDRSVAFYEEVLGLHVIMDFGANKTLTGGLALQTLESWKEFIGTDDVSFGSNDSEVYFEEADFDQFAKKLEKCDVTYVHPIKEHAWGQRVVRIYDPDKHIIEIGEDMKAVCKRFLVSGMTPEQVAERMDVPVSYVVDCMGADNEADFK